MTYLSRVVEAYLTDRAFIFPGQQKVWTQISCGVPQGTVLGPHLWNIGYDWVLRNDLPIGVSVFFNADGILALAQGKPHEAAADAATFRMVKIDEHIDLESKINLILNFQKNHCG